MTVHNFKDKLEWSQGLFSSDVEETIKSLIPDCERVFEATKEEDRTGIDYWAELSGGRLLAVDHKAREEGASKYWRYNEPELALEVYSVCETKKIGWTLDVKKSTEYVFFSFDKSDSDWCFLMPFQLLRMAFKAKGRQWLDDYGIKKQQSGGWTSSAIFVPASVVELAICEMLRHRI